MSGFEGNKERRSSSETAFALRKRNDALTPEIVQPSPGARDFAGDLIPANIKDVEALARWFDYAFSVGGGRFRFGLGGLIGLIPGIGDIFDALVSVYIVTRAVQLGIPRVAIARMLVNIGIEAIAGAVPFAGDLFDIAFKANRRNYLLLRSHLHNPGRQSAFDWLFLFGTVLLVLAGIALPVIGLVTVLKKLG